MSSAVDGGGSGTKRWRSSGSAVVLALLMAAVGCAGSKASRGRDDADLARRYELGQGVVRDYRRAAALLETSCGAGRGVPSACRRLAMAMSAARGVTMNRAVHELLDGACKRGDWLACGGAIEFDEGRARTACEGDRPDACLPLADLLDLSQGGSDRETRSRYIDRACRAGVLDGCHRLLRVEGERAAENVQFAIKRLTAACAEGDADACAAVGTPLDPRVLCDAGDYRACAIVGAEGDLAALDRACERSVPEACEKIAIRARDADPPDPRAPALLERACRLGSDVACRHRQPADVATGCTAYKPAIIGPDDRRRIPRLEGTDREGNAWIAPPGTATLLLAHIPEISWETYDEIADGVGVPVYVALSSEALALRPPPTRAAVQIVLDARFKSEPVIMPKPHALSQIRVDGSFSIIDRDDVVRAVLWPGPSLVPATFARCVRHILSTV